MRILHHFRFSPYSRRVRLALSHKGLEVELHDGRASAEARSAWLAASPFETVPVLVEPDGQTLGESTGITHFLDRAYPDRPPIWPTGGEDALLVFQVAGLVDVVLEVMVNTGNRFEPLHEHPAWEGVRAAAVVRAHRALAALVDRVQAGVQPTIAAAGWSGADMWVYTMVAWIRSFPARAATTPLVARLIALGVTLPAPLLRWADAHTGRPDVLALDT